MNEQGGGAGLSRNERKSEQLLVRSANRTDLGKCTHLYDEIQGTMKHKRFRQEVFVRCKNIDNNKK